MNQQCKVCGEPAAGFHFGAFTCEGCKSFFGRSYNNLGSISECKNNGECVINKKNRTACKACRLRKCLLVGMSKSGSRYGRRSNWFKIHCLLQEQQQAAAQAAAQAASQTASGGGPGAPNPTSQTQKTPPPHHQHPSLSGFTLLGPPQFPHGPLLPHLPRTKEELLLLGLDDYHKHSTSPSVSSPESHNSDSSVELGDARTRGLPLFPGLIPPHFLPPPGLLFPPGYPPLYTGLLQTSTTQAMHAALNNNNSKLARNHNNNSSSSVDVLSKRVFLDAVLQSQRTPTPPEEVPTTPPAVIVPSCSPIQDDPMDLSMKSERGSSPANSERSNTNCSSATLEEGESIGGRDGGVGVQSENSDTEECSDNEERQLKRLKIIPPTPLDLTTKV